MRGNGENKMKKKLKGWQIALIVVLGLFVISGVVSAFGGPSETADNPSDATTENVITSTDITSAEPPVTTVPTTEDIQTTSALSPVITTPPDSTSTGTETTTTTQTITTSPLTTTKPILTTKPQTTQTVTTDEIPTAVLAAVYISSPVGRNEMATVTIQGKPNTEYSISVYYSTTASTAAGLEKKKSDADGRVTWTWKVGGNTNAGEHRIVISGGDEKITVYFTTTE